MKLSICVVTMNRAEQLSEAIKSCLACELPRETEFVIIDNASTDNTENAVKETLEGSKYLYEKLSENNGVGGGRNYAFLKASGEYIYVLDDDAVIDSGDFFTKALSVLDKNKNISTLTTQIYDTALKRDRLTDEQYCIGEKLYKCKMFCGGSHFLRKAHFKVAPYFPNKYGFEELPPSLEVSDAGRLNVFFNAIRIIHKPENNKWDYSKEENHNIIINECAVQYAIKKMMYPRVFAPVLYFAYSRRCRLYLSDIPGGRKKANQSAKQTMRENRINKKIRIKTVIGIYRDFGLAVF